MLYSRNTLLLMVCLAASTTYAQEHRQHGAHEHGGGQLNVALEKNSLLVDLSLPAMNVVGFEHPAKNQEQEDQLERAEMLLKDGVSLLGPSSAGSCTLLNVSVESKLLEHEHEDDHEQEAKHEHEDEHEAEHADEKKHEHSEETHADFDVSYEFECKRVEKLDQLTLSLFKQFPGTQHLQVQLITAKQQGGAELTADNNILKLK